MRLWIAVHLPRLALEAFSPGDVADTGCVIVESERVVAVSSAARAAGVATGMRRGGVTMLAPHATVLERDHARECECMQAAAMAMLQYTPQVSLADESVLLLDVGASLRLFGGVRALCRRVRSDLRSLGFTASISCAPTARGAWLLARRGRGRVLAMASLERSLNRLSALLLPAARPFSGWLEGIGCTTVEELRRLPRPGLQRRCGRAILDMLDAAYGLAPEVHEWFEAPVTFRAQLELFDRVERADELVHGYHRLLLQMLGWLTARQLAVRRIVLEMAHERGREARPLSSIEISLAEPAWRNGHLVRLIKEWLARHVVEAPVIGLALEAPDVVPMAPPNETLFPEPGANESDQAQLFELLTARLGADNVLKPAPKADFRPDVANAWVPASEPIRTVELQAGLPPDVAQYPRPAWILAKPIQLLMRRDRPFYGSPLKVVSNPERIEAGWWSDTQSRDYFVAEGAEHAMYWIYRERVVSDDGEPEPRWFLHGLLG
jgi:protein ImuB